jgi:hypothetical protein
MMTTTCRILLMPVSCWLDADGGLDADGSFGLGGWLVQAARVVATSAAAVTAAVFGHEGRTDAL